MAELLSNETFAIFTLGMLVGWMMFPVVTKFIK